MKHTLYLKTIFVLTFLAGAQFLNAQEQITDAGFIKIDAKLGKVIYHRVLQHQTLYSIARGYGVKQTAIIAANPALSDSRQNLPPVLTIPIEDDQIIYRIPLFKSKSNFLPVYYQVLKQDNLFRVSRVYFDIPTNLLMNRNNLEGNDLKIGQTLHIGWLRSDFEPLIVHEGRLKESDEPEKIANRDLSDRFREEYQGSTLIDKNEVAYWKASETSKGYFIMHRYALPQSIIEIKNPMFDNTVYAKVIGNIPANLYPREVDMVISKEVAEALGAKDPKFFVRSRYKPDRVSASR
ncbi:MAG: LysM peptidoglycan-binding domain-containing protein [Saprospiraceae bacterium]|nr:LysM peptidoglycan-binding domain-containing protein [Saprospiraceae bacterium]